MEFNLRLFSPSIYQLGYDYCSTRIRLFKFEAGIRIYKDPSAYGDFIHIDGMWNGKYHRILHTELLD